MDNLAKTICGILKGEKGIILAYIFGSTAKGAGAKPADVDVAILLKRGKTGLEKLDYINVISAKIEKTAKRRADIVILNSAPPAVKQQVVKYGVLLFERRKGMANQFIITTITEYLDYLCILNFFRDRVLKNAR